MRRLLMMACLLAAATPATAAELVVSVTNIRAATGSIGCLLFNAEQGFPGDPAAAVARLALPASGAAVTCRFAGIAPGTYAVGVSHDANGNGRIDTNMFGIPTEDWGVSNNIRPGMRAPRFDESALQVPEGPARGIEIRLGR